MAEIPVHKKSSLAWLWILLALLLLGLLLWWLLSDDNDAERVAGSETQVVESVAPVTAAEGDTATAGAVGTPPTPETVAAANQRALERLRNDPNYTPRVYFQWDSAEVTPGAQAVLDELINSRADVRTGGVTLVGFADRSGPRPYNRELSEQRAEQVRQYLAGKGIGRDIIDVEAEGETPVRVETGNDVREPLNRRVRVELSDAE